MDADAVVIAEVLAKTSQTTPARAIKNSQRRLRAYDEAAKGWVHMEHAKRKRLEKAGWRVGSTAEFLGLSGVEEALVDMKLTLGIRLRKTREQHKLTQTDLAKRMGSSQSRVAKMEAGDPGVSLDLLVQGLLAAGATRREIASALGARREAASA